MGPLSISWHGCWVGGRSLLPGSLSTKFCKTKSWNPIRYRQPPTQVHGIPRSATNLTPLPQTNDLRKTKHCFCISAYRDLRIDLHRITSASASCPVAPLQRTATSLPLSTSIIDGLSNSIKPATMSSTNVLATKDVNTSMPATNDNAQDADLAKSDVKSMEYHRQVFQSKLEDDEYVSYLFHSISLPLPN